MASEPIKPKSTGEVSSPPKAGQRNAGRLPEAQPSAADDIAAFVAKARAMSPHRAGARGRLVFALDATMSRQPTWDMACALQADMLHEAASLDRPDSAWSTIAASTSAARRDGFPTARNWRS